MTNVKLEVPDISCDHCKTSIEGALRDVPGVSAVDVSVADRTVDVTFDESLSSSAIVGIIEEQGYVVA